jgi:hypothetical protein
MCNSSSNGSFGESVVAFNILGWKLDVREMFEWTNLWTVVGWLVGHWHLQPIRV